MKLLRVLATPVADRMLKLDFGQLVLDAGPEQAGLTFSPSPA